MNNNILEGFLCHKCGSEGPFFINCMVTMKVWDDETEICGDTEWTGDSQCQCAECRLIRTVKYFAERT